MSKIAVQIAPVKGCSWVSGIHSVPNMKRATELVDFINNHDGGRSRIVKSGYKNIGWEAITQYPEKT